MSKQPPLELGIETETDAAERATLYGTGVDGIADLLTGTIRKGEYVLFETDAIEVEQAPYEVTSKRFYDDESLGNEEVVVYLRHPDGTMYGLMAHTYGEPSEDRDWTEVVVYHRPEGPGTQFERAGKVSAVTLLDRDPAAAATAEYREWLRTNGE